MQEIPGRGEEVTRDTMTAKQRVQAAISLQVPDRVPVLPMQTWYFACHHKGLDGYEMVKERERAVKAHLDVYDELGGFDGQVTPGISFIFPRRISGIIAEPLYKVPGVDLPRDSILQHDEREILQPEDYDLIADLGWNAFAEKCYTKFNPRPASKILEWGARQTTTYVEDIDVWTEHGVEVYKGGEVFSPLMFFSMFRTLEQFTFDLYRRPDRVQAAMDALVDDFIQDAIEEVKITDRTWVMLVLERGGGFYYPLKIFERFEWPYMKKMADAWVKEGITPLLHLDQDWTLNLPYFRDLPRGCICELDSCTDIFKAKEILGGKQCIMGDVRASLLSHGTPQEVEEYCTQLIDIVGKGGGFILSSGCFVPVDAKFENVKAMIDCAKTHAAPR